ncbi:MAG: hypothetical protein ACK46D_17055, partial [Roseiflexaceae bacterium]
MISVTRVIVICIILLFIGQYADVFADEVESLRSQNQRKVNATLLSPNMRPLVASIQSIITNPVTATDITAGGQHTCAVANGNVWCWGANSNGQLGDDSTVDRNTPVKVEMPGLSFVSLSASAYKHFCALDSSGNAYC